MFSSSSAAPADQLAGGARREPPDGAWRAPSPDGGDARDGDASAAQLLPAVGGAVGGGAPTATGGASSASRTAARAGGGWHRTSAGYRAADPAAERADAPGGDGAAEHVRTRTRRGRAARLGVG